MDIIATQIPRYVSTGTDLGMKQRFGKGKLTKMFYSTSIFWYNKSLFEKDNFALKGSKRQNHGFWPKN